MNRYLLLLIGLTALLVQACGTCETDAKGKTQCEEWNIPTQR